jgi:hypothetical protein
MTVAAAAGAGLAATSGSAAAAAASAVPWIVATKWVVVGVAAGAVTLGVADGVQHRSSARTEAVHPVVATLPAAAPAPAPAPPSAVETPPPSEAAIEPSSAAPVAQRTARPTAPRVDEPSRDLLETAQPSFEPARPSPRARDDSSLEGEVRLLEEARRALDAHAAAKALSALDRYAREFPAGRMIIESSALRIETLAALGQRDAARELARSFLASHPRSPAAMRVTRVLDAIDSEVKP